MTLLTLNIALNLILHLRPGQLLEHIINIPILRLIPLLLDNPRLRLNPHIQRPPIIHLSVQITRFLAHLTLPTQIHHLLQYILTHGPIILRIEPPRLCFDIIPANLCEEWPFTSETTHASLIVLFDHLAGDFGEGVLGEIRLDVDDALVGEVFVFEVVLEGGVMLLDGGGVEDVGGRGEENAALDLGLHGLD